MKKILLAAGVLLLVTGCSHKSKKMLGLIETIPDEYQVKRNKALEIPPHFKLEEINDRAPAEKKSGKLSDSENALLKEIDDK